MNLKYTIYYLGLSLVICTTLSAQSEANNKSCHQNSCQKIKACCKRICPTGPTGSTGATGRTGSTGIPGSASIGIESLVTNNGSATLPFITSGSERIWSSNGGLNTAPHFNTTTEIWAPFGSATSFITVTPGGPGEPDTFVCSKNIRSLRFYTEIQTSVPSTSRWRVRLYLNGVSSGTGNYWGAPPNNVGNQRVFGVLEYGGILAGTSITVTIDNNTLPNSLQNNSSYFVIEYDLEP